MNIGIVILNYQSYSDTIKLVESLQEQTLAQCLKIVIVDNASPNESYEQLKNLPERFPNVTVLQTGKNLGYAKGNNYGLHHLDEEVHPDYVAILNNDVELPSDCFEKLIARYEQLDNPCLISPRQIMLDGHENIGGNLGRFRDDLKNLFFLYRYFHRCKNTSPKIHNQNHNKELKVDIVPGSFMFASMKNFKAIGFFYPETFLFVEERFVAHEAKRQGFQNYILMDETYLHAHSKTINKSFSLLSKYRMQYDGWIKFTCKCRSQGKFKALLLKPFIYYSLAEIFFLCLIRKIIRK